MALMFFSESRQIKKHPANIAWRGALHEIFLPYFMIWNEWFTTCPLIAKRR